MKNQGQTKRLGLMAVFAAIWCAGCSHNAGSYSILATGQSFKQSTSSNGEIDMLWVVDNSASMDPLQNNMGTNFNSFMNQFTSKGYNFHLAVTGSDAYRAGTHFQNNPALAQFSDGVTNHSGIFDILMTTPNPVNVFVNNAMLGSNGSGDERVFSSMMESLGNSFNQGLGFLRQNSYFAIVILSDEDDFSDPNRPEYSYLQRNGIADHSYSNPGLVPVDTYISQLDTLTSSSATARHYSVNAITVMDQACQQKHVKDSSSSIIGTRYMDMVNKTKGILGSVCDPSYANALQAIQQHILELQSQFFLQGKPIQSTISVLINGTSVPNDATNGWTYDAASNSITFHGAGIPAPGASIAVNFDPETVTF
jgi:hypothetical protein